MRVEAHRVVVVSYVNSAVYSLHDYHGTGPWALDYRLFTSSIAIDGAVPNQLAGL